MFAAAVVWTPIWTLGSPPVNVGLTHYPARLVASLYNNGMGAEVGVMIADALKQPTCKVHTIKSVHA